MSFIAQPAANLHSPGPIGDVTPATGMFTTTGANNTYSQIFYWQGGAGCQLIGGGVNGAFRILDTTGNTGVLLASSADAVAFKKADNSGFAPTQGKLTTDTAATTGLIAGVLAGTTNTSILLYDANGTAYDVPCKAH